MSEDTNQMRELQMIIERGNQKFNMALTTGVQLVLQLWQFMMRMKNEKILSGGEVEDFTDFLKATEGDYRIYNVPYAGAAEGDPCTDIKEELDRMGIRYHMLPDLNTEDQMMQVCVFKKDREKFNAFFFNHVQNYLSGGEKELNDLAAMTMKQSSLVSVPFEGNEGIVYPVRNTTGDFQAAL